MNKKYNIQIIVPLLYEKYDILLPYNITIGECILTLKRALNKMSKGCFNNINNIYLYNCIDGERYSLNSFICDTTIKNGSILVLC